jgi:hypothetical protein
MCQLANQPVFDLLILLPALLATSNPRLRRTESKRPTYSLLTDDTVLLTVIRARSALYIANLDVGLQITQRIRRTREYVNISLNLRVVTTRITITKETSL